MYQRFWGVYLGVKTCEVFHSFLAIIFLGSIVLTSQRLLCIHCFTSLVSFTYFYPEDEPSRLLDGRQFVTELNITKFSLALILGARYTAFDRGVRSRFIFCLTGFFIPGFRTGQCITAMQFFLLALNLCFVQIFSLLFFISTISYFIFHVLLHVRVSWQILLQIY